MKKRTEVATPGFEPAPQQFLQPKSAASDHWAMQPLHQIESVEVFSSAIHTVRTL